MDWSERSLLQLDYAWVLPVQPLLQNLTRSHLHLRVFSILRHEQLVAFASALPNSLLLHLILDNHLLMKPSLDASSLSWLTQLLVSFSSSS